MCDKQSMCIRASHRNNHSNDGTEIAHCFKITPTMFKLVVCAVCEKMKKVTIHRSARSIYVDCNGEWVNVGESELTYGYGSNAHYTCV